MNKQTKDKKKDEEKSAPIDEGQLHIQGGTAVFAMATTEEDMIREAEELEFGFIQK